jgi:EAL and modified HD-GYP domain-containing signal transduction protein
VKLLADQVESMEVFEETRTLGYEHFQGNFFARPVTVTHRDLPACKLNCLRILGEVQRPDLDFRALETTIENELALSYKLLRYLRAACFGRSVPVRCVRDALVFLGERQVRNWASVVALAGMANDKPDELLDEAIARGRFCELLAGPAGMPSRAPDLFIAGMFSLLDAVLDRPLADTLEEMPIAEDIKATLLGAPGPMRDVLDLVLCYTSGRWDEIDAPAARLRLDRGDLPRCFKAALAMCVGLSALR